MFIFLIIKLLIINQMHLLLKCFLFVLAFALPQWLWAQTTRSLRLLINDSTSVRWIEKGRYPQRFSDSLELYKSLSAQLARLHQSGYLLARVDSMKNNGESYHAYLSVGEPFKWAFLDLSGIPPEDRRRFRLKSNRFENQRLNFPEFQSLQHDIISYYENRGYPFCQLALQDARLEDRQLSGRLSIKPHKHITIDSFYIHGDQVIRYTYLYRYLNIHPNDAYNEKQIANIDQRLNDLPFLNATKTTFVSFTPDKADIHLTLRQQKANRFEGFVGLQNRDSLNKQINLTGEIRFSLLNVFHRGESLSFHWKKLENSSQKLNTKVRYPYLLGSPLGVEGQFAVLKKDSSYLTLNSGGALQYFFAGNNYAHLYAQQTRSFITLNDSLLKSNINNVNSHLVGLGFVYSQFDNLLYPKKGFSIDFRLGIGERQLKEQDNESLQEVDFGFQLYVPLWQQQAIRFRSQSAALISNNLYQNELYRLGGLNSLRGFTEESLYASRYSLLTIEWRYYFERFSAVYFFTDGAYLVEPVDATLQEDYPMALGLGVDFAMKAGLLRLGYAVGRQSNNAIDLRTARLHIGFISNF